jgi:Tol biopolymer transport system component
VQVSGLRTAFSARGAVWAAAVVVAGAVAGIATASLSGGREHAEARAPAPSAYLLFISGRVADNELYAASVDGRRVVTLTRNRREEGFLTTSTDGRWFAVALLDDLGDGPAVLMSADGRRRRNLGEAVPVDFSPNSRLLAFAFYTPIRGTEDWNAWVAVVPVNGGRARRLGRGTPLGFSPDGRQLAFLADGCQYGVVNVRTGARRITRTPGRECESSDFYGWSPRSRWFAFDKKRSLLGPTAVYIADGRGHRVRVVRPPRGALAAFPRWLPNGQLAFGSQQRGHQPLELWMVEPASGRTTRVARGHFFDVVFSPSGRQFAYIRGTGSGVLELAIAQLRSGKHIPVDQAYDFADVRWSPSGRMLAFRARKAPGAQPSRENWAIRVRTAAGRVVTLATGLDRETILDEWSPDDKWLAYQTSVSDDPKLAHLVVVSPRWARSRVLFRSYGLGETPLWVPGPLPKFAGHRN